MPMKLAPVVIFVYNRPIHTEKCLSALKSNTLALQSDLIIYSDFAKDSDNEVLVSAVRSILKTVTGFKSISIIERESNFGLAKSIQEGVTEVVNKFDRIIVLEDDLLTHPQFLEYMNTGLELYEKKLEVFEITGFSNLSLKSRSLYNETYFLKLPSTWGWATWKNRWQHYNLNEIYEGKLDHDLDTRKKFNFDNSYNYYQMLKMKRINKINSWGIVWYYNIFNKNGLTLHPTYTLIDQIGFDGSGQNSRNYSYNEIRIVNRNFEFKYPEIICELLESRKKNVKVIKFRKLWILLNFLKSKLNPFK